MEDRFHGGGCSYGDSATLSREHRGNSGVHFRRAVLVIVAVHYTRAPVTAALGAVPFRTAYS